MIVGVALALAVAATTVACARDPEKQWMKSGPYTTQEFRQDTAACSRDDVLDEACLEARGWFAVTTTESPAVAIPLGSNAKRPTPAPPKNR